MHFEYHKMEMPMPFEQLLEQGLANLQKNLMLGMDDLSRQVTATLRDVTPKKTGETAKGWKRNITALVLGAHAEIFNEDPNAIRLEIGTPAHVIRAVHAKALKIPISTLGGTRSSGITGTPGGYRPGNGLRPGGRMPDVVRYKGKFKRVVGVDFDNRTPEGKPKVWHEDTDEARHDMRLEGFILTPQVMHPGTPAYAPVRNNIPLFIRIMKIVGGSIAVTTVRGTSYSSSTERYVQTKLIRRTRKGYKSNA